MSLTYEPAPVPASYATTYPLGARVTVTRDGRDYRGTIVGYAPAMPVAVVLYADRNGRKSTTSPALDIITIGR